jgi:glucose/mannose transport system substrate-binding protein
MYAYDAARIIFAAIDRADNTDPTAIRNQVAATSNYSGVIGIYRGFDTHGDAIPQWEWLEQYQSGQWSILQPAPLEIYSNNSNQPDLNALISVYASTYPNVDLTVLSDPVDLDNRIRSGNPPDGFEYHCGAQLFYDYIEPGDFIDPVTQLWTDQGWMNKLPEQLIDMLTFNGELYCVPLNIHRGNVLWYNMQVFSDTGLTPPTTFAEFFTAAEVISDTGKIPLALADGGSWTDTHLMETVLLGKLGPEKYRGLWDGTIPFNGAEVEDALAIFDQMLNYVNEDHASLYDWQAAVDLVANGEAGMTIMGDWAEGYLVSLGLTPGVDFGWIPVPGTSGSFMVINDSYIMPRNTPDPEEATNWLKIVGSVEGQEAYSLLKTALPARLDADPSLYDLYFQSAMAAYAADELTPSMRHGMAAPSSFIQASDGILQTFVGNRGVESAASAWQQAACEAGFSTCLIYLPLTVR